MKRERILVIDNYDSFTYNLVYLLRELGYQDHLTIVRNDKFELDLVEEFDKILLSPGPGIPEEAGNLMHVIRKYGPTKKILGICLGHQAIAEAFGAKLYNLSPVLHGIKGDLKVISEQCKLFRGIPDTFSVGHYHSWAVSKDGLPSDLTITAESDDGIIMGLAHKKYAIYGLQFHPESILTEYGKEIIQNWLSE